MDATDEVMEGLRSESTCCGSGGGFPIVLELIWEGEFDRMLEGVLEKPLVKT